VNRIFNASNIFGAVAFLAMLAVPGAVDSGMYMTAVALVMIFGTCAWVSVREDRNKK